MSPDLGESEWNHEWHIYSSLAITCVLIFIVIHISTGTAQILGASISPVVGGAFALSDNWKNQEPIVHKWAIAIAFFALIVTVLGLNWNKEKNDE